MDKAGFYLLGAYGAFVLVIVVEIVGVRLRLARARAEQRAATPQ